MNCSRIPLAAAMVLLAGCITGEDTVKPAPVTVQTNVVVKTEVVYTTNVVNRTNFVTLTNVVNQTNFVILTNEVTLTNHVAAVPPPEKPKPVAPPANTLSISLDGAIGGTALGDVLLSEFRIALAQRGYVVQESGKVHASVAITASVSPKANLDEWFVCEGCAFVKIAAGGDRAVCREKKFEVTGARKLGRAPAEKVAVKSLCNVISAWIEDVLKSNERK